MGGVCWLEREDERVREGIGVDRPAPRMSERDRGREGVCGLATTGGVRLSGAENARARAGLGLLGRIGLKWGFPFSREFLMLFYLFSLWFSIQIQIKFQFETKSNMCNNSKTMWSSA
jgi:hypothetical protein